MGLAQPGTRWGVSTLGGASCAEAGENYLASDLAGAVQAMDSVKNPRPENMALFGAPWKGAKSVPSDPGVVGVMEYWSNGLESRDGF